MKTIWHKAEQRGHADHGWLNSYHSFSFAGFYDPSRIHFGMLRVLNDDVVAGGKGFGTHPHDNMEIISIPLKGQLAHKDSMGTEEVIGENDVQVMSAGTGMMHSEYNASASLDVEFLQIWIFPQSRGLDPRHDQKRFDPTKRRNAFQLLVGPMGDASADLKIHQDAYISRVDLSEHTSIEYKLNNPANGMYLFVIDGQVEVAQQILLKRDALGVTDTPSVSLKAIQQADILIIEVPMN